MQNYNDDLKIDKKKLRLTKQEEEIYKILLENRYAINLKKIRDYHLDYQYFKFKSVIPKLNKKNEDSYSYYQKISKHLSDNSIKCMGYSTIKRILDNLVKLKIIEKREVIGNKKEKFIYYVK